jgi:tRNA dimethylallyltransferase
MESKLGPLIVIVGATASGKSELAMEIARQFDGEIIAADSWTVYEGFDIGTAKPSPEEQQRIPHHLLNVTTPDKGFSAVVFKKMASDAIKDIQLRGKLPIIVGGAGLYIDSVIFDYSFLPQHNAPDRAELNALSIEELLNIVNLEGFDTTDIDTNNKRRIIRLIENRGEKPSKGTLRTNTLIIGMLVDKATLLERISSRLDKMISSGLEEEVKSLQDKYGWEIEPMKGIGYKEWRDYFNKTTTLQQTKDNIISSSKKLVKKQETWFKRNKSIHWVENQSQAVALVTTFLGK